MSKMKSSDLKDNVDDKDDSENDSQYDSDNCSIVSVDNQDTDDSITDDESNINIKEIKKDITKKDITKKSIKKEDIDGEDIDNQDIDDEDIDDEDIEDEGSINEGSNNEDTDDEDIDEDIDKDIDQDINQDKLKKSDMLFKDDTSEIKLFDSALETNIIDNASSEEDSDEEDYDYLKKIENNKDFILDSHKEIYTINYNTINKLCIINRDENNNISDKYHRTVPILSKYEKTRILGLRAKQINNGAKPFVSISEEIIDGYIIANLELQAKKIPFIIKRPISNNKFEYWKLEDLEIL